MSDDTRPNGRTTRAGRDPKGASRRDEARRELQSWREAAGRASPPGSGQDDPGANVAVLDAALAFLDRLDALAARYKLATFRSEDRGLTLTLTIPGTAEESDERREALREILRSWREEDDGGEQAEMLESIERGLRLRHSPERGPGP